MTLTEIYENGVVRLDRPAALPEHARVEIDVRLVKDKIPEISSEDLQEIYKVLGQGVDDPSSPGDVAESHNEHQP